MRRPRSIRFMNSGTARLLCVLLICSAASVARADALISTCTTLEFMAKMTAVNAMLPANYDSSRELAEIQDNLRALNTAVCQRVLFNDRDRYESSYPNGRRVSDDLLRQPWYFANGQLFTARPGRDTSIYYPNGQVMAYSWQRGGQTLYWPNGNPATFSFRTINEPWYYPDGHIVTYLAGVKGARWFYPFARLDGQIGQEMISAAWGVDGERFSLIQFTHWGDIVMQRERIRNKLVLSDEELLDVPGVLLMLTRLYQGEDQARLFVPGDGSITGAPW